MCVTVLTCSFGSGWARALLEGQVTPHYRWNIELVVRHVVVGRVVAEGAVRPGDVASGGGRGRVHGARPRGQDLVEGWVPARWGRAAARRSSRDRAGLRAVARRRRRLVTSTVAAGRPRVPAPPMHGSVETLTRRETPCRPAVQPRRQPLVAAPGHASKTAATCDDGGAHASSARTQGQPR